MNVLIFIALIWAVCKLISSCSRNAKEKAAERERERIRAEQQRIREEQARAREWQREAARRQVEHDKAIAKAAREREQLRKEQARQAEEQRKQAAQLAKHNEIIANMTFRIQQAEHDILHVTQQMDEYMPLLWRLDDEMKELDRQISIAQQMGKVDAVNRYQKEKDKVQRKIISLENNIHAAENKLAKAQFIKAQATAKLSA